jgi:hypothetical protein
MTITVDTVSYLLTWGEEVAVRSNRVRNLIGSAHWPSDGAYKEYLLRELLQRHLPRYLDTARGFVRPMLDSNMCSPEIDILVTDSSRHVPLFNEGALQIVVPTAVLATIEVKSTYSTQTLKDSLTNTSRVRSCALVGREPSEVWSAILFTDVNGSFPTASFTRIVEEFASASELPSKAEINGTDQRRLLPQCIAIHGGAVAILSDIGIDEVQIRTFECPTIALSLALAQLFSHIQSITRNLNSPGELEDLLRNIDFSGRQSTSTIRVPKS